MVDTNVTNGEARYTLDTTGLTEGTYTIKVKHKGDGTYNTSTSNGTLQLKQFTWDTLSDWTWKKYSGTSATNLTSPSVTSDGINMGRYNLVVLTNEIPVRLDSFTLSVELTNTYTSNRMLIGGYTTVNETNYNYTSPNIRYNLNTSSTNSRLVEFVVDDGTCTVYLDGSATGTTANFSTFNNFYLMFYSARVDSLIVHDISFTNES